MHADFEETSKKYALKFRGNCEMVARFDEILTTKASKVMMLNLENNIQSGLQKQINQVWAQFDKVDRQAQESDRKFDKFVELMNDKLLDVVQSNIKKQAKLFMAQQVELDTQEILTCLKDKVNKQDLQSLNEIKAGKLDHENLMDCIHTLNDQLKHTIMLLNESVKLSVSDHTDRRNALEKRQV